MSLVVTVCTREGIAMAADSRLTASFTRDQQAAVQTIISTPSSDSASKLFVAAGGIGISTYGLATVNGAPIAGVIESFIIDRLSRREVSPREVAVALRSYFQQLGVLQQTYFHIAGYCLTHDSHEQEVLGLDIASGEITRLNTWSSGAAWAGETDVLQRLLSDVCVMDSAGQITSKVGGYGIPFDLFTLQDAIDFCTYAVRSTIDTMRFQLREKTVGGPIDVLVLKPGQASWIAKKQLHV
jgi:hypothetical protein